MKSIYKILTLFLLLVSIRGMGQFTISGRVINQADKKPVENASVFLNNASVGDKTALNGTFALHNAKPGKYDLIVSIVGFETWRKEIIINSSDIVLSTVEISPKTILLKEVSIKPKNDPDRYAYLEWFEDEFLGQSAFANDCKILNPEMLDLDYNKATKTLTVSSVDFLEIENAALGYKIKYLLNNFTLTNRGETGERVHYEGLALFQKMQGSAQQQKYWQKNRQQAYEGSPMHFFRSILTESMSPDVLAPVYQQGFWLLRLAKYPNPDRPADSLIQAKINFFKKLKSAGSYPEDSLSWWTKKDKLPKTIDKLLPTPLQKDDIVKPTDQNGLFALGLSRNIYSLFINYDKYRFKYRNEKINVNIPATRDFSSPQNIANSLVSFNTPYAIFDRNGGIVNTNSLTFAGVWARKRIAELLPLDYEPVPDNNTVADNILSKLNNFEAKHIAEKAYLHFDKPYYAAGDTIYFKAYVTQGEARRLSDSSSVLHVDLINAAGKIDQSIKLAIDSGLAWGDFTLPDSLPKGNYRVRAYTRWMKNEGDDAFFDQAITIGSNLKNKKNVDINLPVTASTAKPDIQFLPEGGSLVAGIESKIAFKAIGVNGLGIDVKGVVLDNNNRQISTFTSSHRGMGYFNLKPDSGKTYTAQMTYPNGSQNTIALPKVNANGITLVVNDDSLATAGVTIRASKTYYQQNRGKDFFLIVCSGDMNTKINCTLDSNTVKLNIIKRRLNTGVARFTLFSPKGEALCERLLFIQNNDGLKLQVSSNKPEYATGEKVQLKLNAINASGEAATGHFSVSVTNETTVPMDKLEEHTILTNLLLTSDLKGYVEQPNYYFTDTSAAARKNLDVLMLTQGYRRFEWTQVLKNNQAIDYQPERGLEISGQVTNLFGKPVAKGGVTLLPAKGKGMLSAQTDDKGIFHFNNLLFMDTTRFMLSAINAKGKNATKIIWFPDKSEAVLPINQWGGKQAMSNTVMAAYMNNDKTQHDAFIKYGNLKGKMLKEVKIKGKKEPEYKSLSYVPESAADQVIHGSDIPYGGALAVRLAPILRGFYIEPHDGNKFVFINNVTKGEVAVMIDGQLGDLDDVATDAVESIYVLRPPSSYVYDALNGILIITTRPRSLRTGEIASIGVLPISPQGFYKAREFYSPKYDHPETAKAANDFRSTIYWNPEVTTNSDGIANFQYYNAGSNGTYKVVIEGIDNNGNLGRVVYRYKVSD